MRLISGRPILSLLLACVASATLPAQQVANRLTQPVSENSRVTLHGNVHPVAMGGTGTSVSTPIVMDHMVLVLQPDSTHDAALTQLLAQQHDPASPQFHKFLTPADFGSRFGVSDGDINTISAWLTSHGFKIDEIPAGRSSIVFSGTSDQVASAFRTEIRRYVVGGEQHYANASDPQIPAALAQAVHGVLKLHNFRHSSSIQNLKTLGPAWSAPKYTYGSGHYIGPADFATIYDVNPLYANNVNGSGQSIAIVARSNIDLSDVSTFRSQFGLPANQPKVTIVNSDPGLNADETEAILDTEWSGAVAPKATVNLIVASSTNTADGVDLSAQYIVNHNVAPIVSVSYGSCESYMGSSELAFYDRLWQQAAAQGMTVFVSSGDSGASGCDGGSSTRGSGRGINGLCSSSYSVCVGGTQFNEGSNPGQYWLAGNNSLLGSAQSYIPEGVWNESANVSGGSELWSGGGGASLAFAKPSWQKAPGVPADGARDVPDVSLTAAIHDGYLIVGGGNLLLIGGTSASSPSFAGLMALVDQKTASRQGNANTNFYLLAVKQSNGGTRIFHDVSTGNNSVPGVTGYSAVAGYDLATGLGSVDATLLVNHWTDTTSTTPGLSLTASQGGLTLGPGQSTNVNLAVGATGTFNSAVTLSVTGAPSGLTASLSSTKIAAPGSGASTLTLAASKTLAFGTYTLTVTAQGSNLAATSTIVITVQTTGSFSFTTTTNYFSVGQGNSGVMNVMLTPSGGFSAPVSITLPGLPTGATMSAPAITLSGPAATTIPLTIAIGKTTPTGVYQLLVTAAGGGQTKTFPLQLTVTGPSDCTLGSNPSTVTIEAGKSVNVEVFCGSVQGNFNSALALNVSSNKPTGITIQQLRAQIVPGNATGQTTLAITSANTAASGNYTITVQATTPIGFNKTISIPFVVTAPAALLVTSSAQSVTVQQGQSAKAIVTTKHSGSFNLAATLVVAGLPAGVTAALSQTSVPSPGDATITITLSASPIAAVGSNFYFVVAALTSNQSYAVPIGLAVAAGQNFTLKASSSSTSLVQGATAAAATISIGSFVNGFSSAVTLSAANAPAGITASFAKATLSGTGAATTLSLVASKTAIPGPYKITVVASGGGITQSATVPVTVVATSTAKK